LTPQVNRLIVRSLAVTLTIAVGAGVSLPSASARVLSPGKPAAAQSAAKTPMKVVAPQAKKVTTKPSKKPAQASWLFVQSTSHLGAHITLKPKGTGTLTMLGDNTIIAFTDRPVRKAVAIKASRFQKMWRTGPDSFKADPPNAVLTFPSDNGLTQRHLGVELVSMKTGKRADGVLTTTYGIKVLHISGYKDIGDAIPKQGISLHLGASSLLIDSWWDDVTSWVSGAADTVANTVVATANDVSNWTVTTADQVWSQSESLATQLYALSASEVSAWWARQSADALFQIVKEALKVALAIAFPGSAITDLNALLNRTGKYALAGAACQTAWTPAAVGTVTPGIDPSAACPSGVEEAKRARHLSGEAIAKQIPAPWSTAVPIWIIQAKIVHVADRLAQVTACVSGPENQVRDALAGAAATLIVYGNDWGRVESEFGLIRVSSVAGDCTAADG
jgi:hypothetical protein